jgi:MFS transporter, AAHS family, 4-hydroxybenzoate transporter
MPASRRPLRLHHLKDTGGRRSIVEQRRITLASAIDRMPPAYLIRIVGVCFLIVLMDGFDTQAIGFAAVAISSSLAIPITAFGQIFSAGLLGAMLGALVLGPAADWLGRRWMLVAAVVTFSIFSLLTPRASSFTWLLVIRFCAGLGLGGAIPNLLALSSEYAPPRIQGLLTGVLWAAFPLGGVIGAVTSAHLLPLFGWPVLFYIGGTIPLILAVAVARVLPESLQVLLRRPDGQRRVKEALDRIGLESARDEVVYEDTEEHHSGIPLRHLLSGGRATVTLLLWTASFMCFALLIVLVLWTPALLRKAGVDATPAALIVGMVNLGSVAGTAVGGRLIDRFTAYVALPILFTAGGLAAWLLGQVTGAVTLLGLFAALSGFFVGAASGGLLSVAVLIYPSMMRATGLGWTMALGRMGQVTGPLIIGALLARGLAVDRIFLCCVAPALCAAGAAGLMRWSALRTALSHDRDEPAASYTASVRSGTGRVRRDT